MWAMVLDWNGTNRYSFDLIIQIIIKHFSSAFKTNEAHKSSYFICLSSIRLCFQSLTALSFVNSYHFSYSLQSINYKNIFSLQCWTEFHHLDGKNCISIRCSTDSASDHIQTCLLMEGNKCSRCGKYNNSITIKCTNFRFQMIKMRVYLCKFAPNFSKSM